jgi:hypothetical protein
MKREGEGDMARQKRSMARLIFGSLIRLFLTAGLLLVLLPLYRPVREKM